MGWVAGWSASAGGVLAWRAGQAVCMRQAVQAGVPQPGQEAAASGHPTPSCPRPRRRRAQCGLACGCVMCCWLRGWRTTTRMWRTSRFVGGWGSVGGACVWGVALAEQASPRHLLRWCRPVFRLLCRTHMLRPGRPGSHKLTLCRAAPCRAVHPPPTPCTQFEGLDTDMASQCYGASVEGVPLLPVGLPPASHPGQPPWPPHPFPVLPVLPALHLCRHLPSTPTPPTPHPPSPQWTKPWTLTATCCWPLR